MRGAGPQGSFGCLDYVRGSGEVRLASAEVDDRDPLCLEPVDLIQHRDGGRALDVPNPVRNVAGHAGSALSTQVTVAVRSSRVRAASCRS